MSGYTIINQNVGGEIHLENSFLFLMGCTQLRRNEAGAGAAIFAQRSQLHLYGDNRFENNTAVNGGALFVMESSVTLHGTARFTSNSAGRLGGAMFIDQSSLSLELHSRLITSHNHASLYGGAIYHRDSIVTSGQCEYKMNLSAVVVNITVDPQTIVLPQCFLNLNGLSPASTSLFTVNSYNDTAGNNGNFLYGGQLDRCRVYYMYQLIPTTLYRHFKQVIQINSAVNTH